MLSNLYSNLSTSQKISIKFGIYVSIILALVAILINSIFAIHRYRGENNKLNTGRIPKIHISGDISQNISNISDIETMINPNTKNPIPKNKIKRVDIDRPMEAIQIIENNPSNLTEIQSKIRRKNIAIIDDQYIIYKIGPKNIRISNITYLVNTQYNLIWISILVVLRSSIVTYIVSHRLVRNSMRNIYQLSDYISQMDLGRDSITIPRLGPDHDEIQNISIQLQSAHDKLQSQSQSLKEFVSQASHELQTPLMNISSTLDLHNTHGDISQTITQSKQTIKYMSQLIQNLLYISQLDYQKIEHNYIDVSQILNQIIQHISISYPHISANIKTLPGVTIYSQIDMLTILLKNIIHNAYKYTDPKNPIINIYMQDKLIQVSNNGNNISIQNQKYMRNRFWRDRSVSNISGHGLGLYICQSIANKLNIQLSYNTDQGLNNFIISWG